MIERKVVAQKMREFLVQEFISQTLRNTGQSHTKIQRTPMGEKIIIHTSRPGLIVGKSGQNIKKLTASIKKKFDFENPQIEIAEVENINLNAQIVAERIASSLERFGSKRFKGITHQAMQNVMNAGAMGIEILISGKVPSARAKSWRFYQGYLKKCGDIAVTKVAKAYATAKLKSGVIGIKVRIMPPDLHLPDELKIVAVETETAVPTPSQNEEKEEERKESSEKKKRKRTTKKKKEEPLAPATEKNEVTDNPAVVETA